MYFKVFIPLVFLFVSCDGFQAIDGIVVDSETHKPITNVQIREIKEVDALGFSDEQGYFEIHQIAGFAFGDKEMAIVFSKENYISDTITFINNESKLIKLERIAEKK
ncbi:MAG: hypothetical protein ACK4M1_07370 [Flavobacterium sp.]